MHVKYKNIYVMQANTKQINEGIQYELNYEE